MKYVNNFLFENILIKIILLLFIIYLGFQQFYQNLDTNNSFQHYFKFLICKFLYLNINYNCENHIYNDSNFYDNIIEINDNINLFINIKKAQIENLILLIGIIPFLKKKSILSYKINNNKIFNLFKNKLKNIKVNKGNIIKFNKKSFLIIIENFKDFVYFKWEFIPEQKLLNNIRHIINDYYNESCLDIFDKSLNFNLNYYINTKSKRLSFLEISNLISKCYNEIKYFFI